MAVNSERRRLPREERAAQIVATAAEFFAEKGFSASTRELALRLGVTQALLYRYFASKEQLIDEVFNSLYADRWDAAWEAALRERAHPLADRLRGFYEHLLGGGDPLRLRLFIRANLDGLDFARRYRFCLSEHVLGPVIDAMRGELGLARLDQVPLRDEERELALVLHGGLVFTRIRKHIYRSPVPDDVAVVVDMHVAAFLPGALRLLREMHA